MQALKEAFAALAPLYPMGAVTASEKKLAAMWEDPAWIGERKYDGSRYMVRKQESRARLTSRSVSKDTGLPVDKTDRVPHLAEFFEMVLPDGTVLDGEIITHENCESTDVTSIMGSSAEEAIRKQKERGYVKYIIFDILFWKGLDLTGYSYLERRKSLEKIHSEHLGGNRHILLAPVYTKNKEQEYLDIVAGGGEGVILKHVKGRYEYSFDGKKLKKPQNTWAKVKKYDTYDAVILGFTEPTKEYTGKAPETWLYWYKEEADELAYRENTPADIMRNNGYIPVSKPFFNEWIGAVRFGQYKDGELVEIGQTSGISDDIKQYFTDNREACIGQVIEVGAMRQNKKTGALVHPRFLKIRDDKDAEQCILGEV